ncbi:uncharacterized protein LOC128132899 [Lactuca sativa]|uniref:uncharacterized protein LOC128132899 n=1 Tax=Lactuca sativa TaxID=4236 RepID=UPI0022AF179C|nr:uncharacterized protein LOC128132899 [Lactuca sativa]
MKDVAADPEEKRMELQFALMVSSTSEPKKNERQNAELIAELDTLKDKFETVDFYFRKFNVSGEVVANMIDHCMQFKHNQSKGLGYDKVPPPFNHTYQFQPLSKEEIANEPFMAGVPDLIKKFIVLIENKINHRVKALRTDNGTEFQNSVLDHLCTEKGIMHQYSSAYTPQQNSGAKRRNRTLKDVARTMVCDSKLPVLFWAEAINNACYVQNRVLINKAQMKTPYEILYCHKPSVGHFRIFGCPCTVLHLESNTRFNAKADDCYFVGYDARTAYRVYNKKTKQIVESYDVRWLEENEKDARVGPDWLFDYTYLFKSINVSSDSSFGYSSSSKTVCEEEDEEVVYRSPTQMMEFSTFTISLFHPMISARRYPQEFNAIIRLKMSLVSWATELKLQVRMEMLMHVSILALSLK